MSAHTNLTLHQACALEHYLIKQGNNTAEHPNKINPLAPIGTTAQFYQGAMQWAAEYAANHGITIHQDI